MKNSYANKYINDAVLSEPNRMICSTTSGVYYCDTQNESIIYKITNKRNCSIAVSRSGKILCMATPCNAGKKYEIAIGEINEAGFSFTFTTIVHGGEPWNFVFSENDNFIFIPAGSSLWQIDLMSKTVMKVYETDEPAFIAHVDCYSKYVLLSVCVPEKGCKLVLLSVANHTIIEDRLISDIIREKHEDAADMCFSWIMSFFQKQDAICACISTGRQYVLLDIKIIDQHLILQSILFQNGSSMFCSILDDRSYFVLRVYSIADNRIKYRNILYQTDPIRIAAECAEDGIAKYYTELNRRLYIDALTGKITISSIC